MLEFFSKAQKRIFFLNDVMDETQFLFYFIPLSNQLHRGTSPVKVFEFYGLVDQGKYRNTFQTDLSYPGKLPW